MYQDFLLDDHNLERMGQDMNFKLMPTKSKKGPKRDNRKFASLLNDPILEQEQKMFSLAKMSGADNGDEDDQEAQAVAEREDPKVVVLQYGLKLDEVTPDFKGKNIQ